LGVGVWGFGPNPPTPKPQSPIPNPQSPFLKIIFVSKYIKLLNELNNYKDIFSKKLNT